MSEIYFSLQFKEKMPLNEKKRGKCSKLPQYKPVWDTVLTPLI